MEGMTVQARVDDIAARANLSPEIVRRVLNAETESIVKSLERGERATLIGRATLRPEIRQRLAPGGGIQQRIRVQITLASQIEDHLERMDGFKPKQQDTSVADLKQQFEAQGKGMQVRAGQPYRPTAIRKESVLD